MFDERVFHAQLYNNMAEATIGLYESKDLDFLPYVLFVVGFNLNKEPLVFYPKNLNLNGGRDDGSLQLRTWLSVHGGNEIWQNLNPRYIPKLINFSTPIAEIGKKGRNLEYFFAEHFTDRQFTYVDTWPIKDEFVYVVLYRDNLMEEIPEMVWAAAENVVFRWREYYKNTQTENVNPPLCDINKVMEETLNKKCVNWNSINECLPTIIKISSMYYESGRGKGSIAITDDKNKDENALIMIDFDDRDDINKLRLSIDNARQLRKLLETTKGELSILIDKHTLELYGIGMPKDALYVFKITGHMEWYLNECKENNEEIQLLRYKNGSYYLPLNAEVKGWYIQSRAKRFSDSEKKMLEKLLDEKNLQRYTHGALFVISSEAKNEVKRLCGLKRGMQICEVNLLEHEDVTAALCAIDGALFLDNQGTCYGIGVILDGDALAYGKPDRGSRYNSAKTYISKHCLKPYAVYAIVVSQDGYIDIISTNDKDCHPLNANCAECILCEQETV